MKAILAYVAVFLLCSVSTALSFESATDLNGDWGSKYGNISIVQKEGRVTGKLSKPSGFCPFEKDLKILDGEIRDDRFIGKYFMCQADDECGPPVWAEAILLIGKKATVLSGTAHSKKAKCPLVGFSVNKGGKRGLYFKKLVQTKSNRPKPLTSKDKQKNRTPKGPVMFGPKAEPGRYDPRAAIKSTPDDTARLLMGKRLLEAGRFEQARGEFEKVLVSDPGNPTALTGIGASHYARQDYPKALEYYKKALAEDPNFGMAYYNIACVYSKQSKIDLALDYLKIAFLNGFVVLDMMESDPDLENLRHHSSYREMVKGNY